MTANPNAMRRGATNRTLDLTGYNFAASGSGNRLWITTGSGPDPNLDPWFSPNSFNGISSGQFTSLPQLTINSILTGAPLGERRLQVWNMNSGAFSINDGLLRLTDALTLDTALPFYPTQGVQGSEVPITIKGTGLDLGPLTITLTDSNGVANKIVAHSIQIVSASEVKAVLTIPSDAAVDSYTLSVKGGDDASASATTSFTVRAPGDPLVHCGTLSLADPSCVDASGVLTCDWTTTTAHWVSCSVVVPAGSRLILRNGTTTSFSNSTGIVVQSGGTIDLQGTSGKPIVLLPKGSGDRSQGILVESGGIVKNNLIEYLEIDGASSGLKLTGQTGLSINHVAVTNATVGLWLVNSNTSLTDVSVIGAEDGLLVDNGTLSLDVGLFSEVLNGVRGRSGVALTLRRLRVTKWSKDGVSIEAGSTLTLQNSLFHSPTPQDGYNTSALLLQGSAKVHFNTFDGAATNGKTTYAGINSPASGKVHEIIGNIATGFGYGYLYHDDDSVSQNDGFGNSAANFYRNGSVVDPSLSNNYGVDPLYRDATNKDFRLAPSSTLFDKVDVTTLNGMPSDDLLGAPRVASYDLGAYESVVVVSVAPKFVKRGATTNLVFSGHNFRYDRTILTVWLSGAVDGEISVPAITSGDVTNANTTLTLGLVVSGNTALFPAGRDVEVTNLSGVSEAKTLTANAFSIQSEPALVPSPIAPSSGVPGATIQATISGVGFSSPTVTLHIEQFDVDGQKYDFTFAGTDVQVIKDGLTATFLLSDSGGPFDSLSDTQLATFVYDKLKLTLTVTNADGGTSSVEQAFTIVKPNNKPVVDALPTNVTCVAGYHCSFQITVSDPDGDSLTIDASSEYDITNIQVVVIDAGKGIYEVRFDTAPGLAGTQAGVLVVVSDGKSSVMPTVKLDGVANTAPPKPLLKRPTIDGNGVYPTSDYVLYWDPVVDTTLVPGSPTTYKCLFSKTSDFGTPIVSTTITPNRQGELSCTLPNGIGPIEDSYAYVKIVAIDGADPQLQSESDMAQIFYSAVDDPPGAPTPVAPANGSDVKNTPPTYFRLTVDNTSDPEHEALTYTFEIWTAPNENSTLVAKTVGVTPGTTTTEELVTATLQENTTYYWRARAVEPDNVVGPWSEWWSFRLNNTNSAPDVPQLKSPDDGAQLTSTGPTLSVQNGSDPEGDPISYLFQLDTVDTFDSADLQSGTVAADVSGTTSWTPTTPLSEGKTYYWRVLAQDGKDAKSGYSTVFSFSVNSTNQAPNAPSADAPKQGQLIEQLVGIELTIGNATDPDGDPLTYTVEIYSDSGLNALADKITGITPNLNGSQTKVTLGSALTPGTYYWRVRAVDDKSAPSAWSSVETFVVKAPVVEDESDTTSPDADDDGVTPDLSPDLGGPDLGSPDLGIDLDEPDLGVDLGEPDSADSDSNVGSDVEDDLGLDVEPPDALTSDDTSVPDLTTPDAGSGADGDVGSDAGGELDADQATTDDGSATGDTGQTTKSKGGGCSQTSTTHPGQTAPISLALLLAALLFLTWRRCLRLLDLRQ